MNLYYNSGQMAKAVSEYDYWGQVTATPAKDSTLVRIVASMVGAILNCRIPPDSDSKMSRQGQKGKCL